MTFSKRFEEAIKQFYLKSQKLPVKDMSAKLFWIPNSLVIWLGCNIFSEDFTTKSFKFARTMIILVTYTICLFNSCYYYRDDTQKLLFASILFAMFIQIIGKLFTFVMRRPDLMKLVEQCQRFIDYLENDAMLHCFEKWIMFGFYAESILGFLFLTGLILILIYPVLVYLILDFLTLIFPSILPFTDDRSILGFSLNYLCQIVFSITGIVGFLAAIMDVVIFVVHFLAFFEALEIMVDLLQEMIEAEQNSENVIEKQRILKKLVEGHNWIYEYITNFENSFQTYHLFDIAASIFATVLCLYGVTKVNN